MPLPDNRSKYKRTNLFLLRMWCDDPGPSPGPDPDINGTEDERSGPKWHGRVQRTVSGEAHNFEGKEALIEVLETMLYKDRLEHSKPILPPGNRTAENDLPGDGNTNSGKAKQGTE